MRPNEVSYKVIGAAMAVHSALGAGLLESAYEKALGHEFTRVNLKYRRQVQLAVAYGEVHTESISSSRTALSSRSRRSKRSCRYTGCSCCRTSSSQSFHSAS